MKKFLLGVTILSAAILVSGQLVAFQCPLIDFIRDNWNFCIESFPQGFFEPCRIRCLMKSLGVWYNTGPNNEGHFDILGLIKLVDQCKYYGSYNNLLALLKCMNQNNFMDHKRDKCYRYNSMYECATFMEAALNGPQ